MVDQHTEARNNNGDSTGPILLPLLVVHWDLALSSCFPYKFKHTEAIHIRLHPNNINMDSRIEIPEAWMPTVKKHNSRRAVLQQTAEVTNHRNSEDRNAPITAVENQPITAEHRAL